MLTYYSNSVVDFTVPGLRQGQETSFIFVMGQELGTDAGFCMVMTPGAARQSGKIQQPATTRRNWSHSPTAGLWRVTLPSCARPWRLSQPLTKPIQSAYSPENEPGKSRLFLPI